MRHFISGICCLIVGLQLLIGVPLIVCVAFHGLVVSDVLGPVSVVYHPGDAGPPATVPPPNRIPTAIEAPADNPILQTRVERGSPLAGTVLESDSLEEEQGLFVAAVEKAASECVSEPAHHRAIAPAQPVLTEDLRAKANQFAISQLYAMADMDEHAADFQRADQWRALAREIRNQVSSIHKPEAQARGPAAETHDYCSTPALRKSQLPSSHATLRIIETETEEKLGLEIPEN